MKTKIQTYIRGHDESAYFFVSYLIVGIALSLFFNIGVFALLVACHYLLDLSKYRLLGRAWKPTFGHSLRDITIDVSFIFVGLALAVYLHHGLALGISKGAFKAIYLLEVAAKTAIAERTLNAFVHYTMYIKDHKLKQQLGDVGPSRFERFSWSAIGASITLILVSPLILGFTYSEFFNHILAVELVPNFEIAM